MQRYVALLGGINVGGHRVKMADLRNLFETLGYANVATFIASGNVIFEAEASDTALLQSQIEQHLKAVLGYNVPTFIRSSEELAAIASYQPFPNIESNPDLHTLSILFLTEILPEDVQNIFLGFRTPVDEFHILNREIYWLCRKKITESMVDWSLLGKTINMPPVTMRNVTTVRKIAAKFAS